MNIYRECPACSGQGKVVVGNILQCQRCQAIYGSCSRALSYEFVQPRWYRGLEEKAETRYFDFIVTNQFGETRRRHGWYDIHTKTITQVG